MVKREEHPDVLANWRTLDGCVFCALIHGEGPRPADYRDRGAAVSFTPLDPVVPGHLLVVPKHHVQDFMAGPGTFAIAARIASLVAYDVGTPHNLITSAGAEATQTVMHLHIHLVPRAAGDGLHLPWTGQTTTEEKTP